MAQREFPMNTLDAARPSLLNAVFELKWRRKRMIKMQRDLDEDHRLWLIVRFNNERLKNLLAAHEVV